MHATATHTPLNNMYLRTTHIRRSRPGDVALLANAIVGSWVGGRGYCGYGDDGGDDGGGDDGGDDDGGGDDDNHDDHDMI